jgi:hypothetical protein
MRLVAVGQQHHYVCAPRPATAGASIGMCVGVDDVTVVWERIELPYERIALRTPYGRFLSCQLGDDGPRMTLSDDLGPREAFEEILWPDGAVSFRTCELTYVSTAAAVRGGNPVIDAGETDTVPEARFRYLDPPRTLVEMALQVIEGQPQVPDMPRQFAHTSDVLRDSPKGNGAV